MDQPPTNTPDNIKQKPPARRRRLPRSTSLAMIAILALIVGLWFGSSRRVPKPLPVDTTGLDPAVARLIESTIQEVNASPRSAETWGKLGSALLHYEFKPQAQFAFQQAERLDPSEPRWPYLLGVLMMDEHSEMVLAKFQTAAALCRDRPDQPRLRLAQLLLERGQIDQSADHFQTLLRQQPKHPLALLGMARVRLAQGRPGESTNLLARCLADPFTAKSAHALLARLCLQLGNPADAQTAARHSARLPPDADWPDPYWNEALRYRVGKKARLDQAVALLDQNRLPDAFHLLTTVTNEYPADAEAYYFLGWILNQDQRGPEAERNLREHLRLCPDSPKGQAQLAAALLAQERYHDALPVLQHAIQLKPTWSDLHFNLGYACAHLGQADQAIGHFRNALRHRPDYIDAYLVLADLLSRRGARAEAVQLLRQALALNPDDQRANSLLQKIQANE